MNTDFLAYSRDTFTLRSGPLQHPARNTILGFQIDEVRHYGIAPFQLEEYVRCRMLLIAVARKEHLD